MLVVDHSLIDICASIKEKFYQIEVYYSWIYIGLLPVTTDENILECKSKLSRSFIKSVYIWPVTGSCSLAFAWNWRLHSSSISEKCNYFSIFTTWRRQNEPDWSISQLSSSIALALNLLKISIMFGSDISSKDFDRDNPSKFDISIFSESESTKSLL